MSPGHPQTAERPRRSVLYMPASNARALEKARTLDADTIVLDLEDSVAPEAKTTARDQAGAALRSGAYGHRELTLRINGLDTPWGHADLQMAASANPAAIVLPKPDTPDELVALSFAMDRAGMPHTVGIWAMIETTRALLALPDIAALASAGCRRLGALILGLNDLHKETRSRPTADRSTSLAWLAAVVVAGRANGLVVLDSVCNDFRDCEQHARECRQARDFGFDGKTLIHPDQIAIANAAFAPTDTELADAQRIVGAFEQPEHRGKGAIQIDGRMVELLHAVEARRLLALATMIAERTRSAG